MKLTSSHFAGALLVLSAVCASLNFAARAYITGYADGSGVDYTPFGLLLAINGVLWLVACGLAALALWHRPK